MLGKHPWHQALLNHVGQQLCDDRLPQALLFRHRRDYDDTQLAQNIAQLLLCDSHQGDDHCQHCQLITQQTHPNVVLLDVINHKVGIKDIRELEQQMWQTAIFDKPKVALILGIDLLSIGAQNALLKTLEEPPKNAYFVLSVTNISHVLPTIISRVQRLRHGRVDTDELYQWLQRQSYQQPPTTAAIAKMAKLADYLPQQTLALLRSPEMAAERETEKKQFAEFLAGQRQASALIRPQDKDTMAEKITRYCRYTEGMIRFLFEKNIKTADKNDSNSVQCCTWHGVSLRSLYRLHDVLMTLRQLSDTNVNMTMQLTTHLVDWQHDRKK